MTPCRAALALAAALLLAGEATAGYREGVEAYRKGDYGTAWEQWQAIADLPPGQANPAVQAEAMYALGMLYWMGQGVTQDAAESAKWLERAARLNHSGAQSKLGFLYMSGSGVPADAEAAEKWLRMAASQGDVDAQYNLGVMYRDGIGTPPHPEHAMQWFREAAARGDAVSAAIVERYIETGELPQAESVHGRSSETTGEPPTLAAHATKPSLLDEGWIRARDPEHYTIQVIAVTSLARLEELVGRHADHAPFAVYQVENGGKPLHVLVLGDFAGVEAARAARNTLPVSLQAPERAWIRRFGKVQELIAAEHRNRPEARDADLD